MSKYKKPILTCLVLIIGGICLAAIVISVFPSDRSDRQAQQSQPQQDQQDQQNQPASRQEQTETQAPQEAPTEPTPSSPPPTEAPPQAYQINQDVTVGNVRWKITEAQNLGNHLESDNQFFKPLDTVGFFVLVKLEVENLGTQALTFSDISITDSQGRTFEDIATKVIGFVETNELCTLQQLNPNIPQVCTKIFELPEGASGLRVKVGDLNLFGGEEAEVELGF